MSKHAIHSDVAYKVRYSGEFHIRPSTTNLNKYKLIIDNNSGTYSPDVKCLPLVEKLFKTNFPDIEIEVLDRGDPKLLEYIKECNK